MSNKLFRDLNPGANNAQNTMPNYMAEMQSLRSNPMGYLMSKKLGIPAEIQNNPQAIVQYWMNTGKMSQDQFAYLQKTVFGNQPVH